MKVERAVKKLPAWKVAEFIDRIEDRMVNGSESEDGKLKI